MANKLKVNELRAELAQRGLDTGGTKATLVERLESAILKERKSSKDTTDGSMHKKRSRQSKVEEDSNGSKKFRAVDNFQEMGIQQLREQAILQGLSASGSKKELLKRLCTVLDNDSRDILADKQIEKDKEDDVKQEENQVTTIKKDTAVLDQYLPDHIKAQYHVLQQGEETYNAVLNQTNVGENNNKFYVIQALESDDSGKFMVYNRWGRVGIKGQDKLMGPYTSGDNAIKEFESKFFAKTNNHWSNRNEFICYPKYYTWLEMDSSMDKESDVQAKPNFVMEIQQQNTKVDPRIASFISLICNVNMMRQQMLELGYNAEKLPLGKLSKSMILKGYDVLKRIDHAIRQSDRKKLEQLSGEFYTVIPRDFGFRKMRDFVIDTHYELKRKLEMVEALGEIEAANSLFTDDIYTKDDPVYSHYQCLRCSLTPLEVDSKEYLMIERYMRNTDTTTRYNIDIVQIFRASREGESERFKKFSSTKNRMLLWHGSQLTNWTGILSQGLRIAPPEAPTAGYSFGKGVYFADMLSKSAPYCQANSAATDGVLILCEVALGDMAELLSYNHNADRLPKGKLSTKGVGRIAPDPLESEVLEDGVIVPLGKPKEQTEPKGVCYQNEYIVYNVDQIQIRYVVHVNFAYTYKR